MHVLIVEDDPAISRLLEMTLKNAEMTAFATSLGAEAIELAKIYDYDLILLDLNLPDMSGHEVIRLLRLSKVKTPVLILTGAVDTKSKLKGFDLGADDYLTKPFHRDELLARISAIVRRSKGHSQSVIRTGRMELNLDEKSIQIDGKAIQLTVKEYQMLELLSLRKGTMLTKEMFLNHLYGGVDEPGAKIIDVFICKLRKKLSDVLDGNTYIDTVWGRGYVLRDPVPDMVSKLQDLSLA
jgi:two-component system cell cycle response regulator CtrA